MLKHGVRPGNIYLAYCLRYTLRQTMATQTYLYVIKVRGNTLRSLAGQFHCLRSTDFTPVDILHDGWNGLLSEVNLTVLNYNERIRFKLCFHLKDKGKQVCDFLLFFLSNYLILDLDSCIGIGKINRFDLRDGQKI